MTDTIPEAAATRVQAYLDAYPSAAFLPESEQDILDAIGGAELHATDLRALLLRLADLERTPRCGATTPGLIDGSVLGPCIRDHGHDGMHEEADRWQAMPGAGLPSHMPGARWTERNDALAVARARIRDLERDCNDWRNASYAEAQGGKVRAEMLARAQEVLAEIERRALTAEKAGIASEYVALWGVHGLLADALGPGGAELEGGAS